jgi:hypothetical protein
MANTFVKIGSTVTVGSGGAATIDFSSIPATYSDLVVKLSARASAATTDQTINLRFNGSSAASYSARRLYGAGSGSGGSDSDTSATSINMYSIPGNGAAGNTFGNAEIYIPNYAGSTNKSVSVDIVSEDNATRALADLVAGLWSNTAAINQITILVASTTFMQYSSATLYGIKNS